MVASRTACCILISLFQIPGELCCLFAYLYLQIDTLDYGFYARDCFRVDMDRNGHITAYELGKALSNGKCCNLCLFDLIVSLVLFRVARQHIQKYRTSHRYIYIYIYIKHYNN